MATWRVKRQNPYLRARPCRARSSIVLSLMAFNQQVGYLGLWTKFSWNVLGEPHEPGGNIWPRYMIIQE